MARRVPRDLPLLDEAARDLSVREHYGAIQLKHVVGRNTVTGLAISILIHLVVVGTFFVYSTVNKPKRNLNQRIVVYNPVHIREPVVAERQVKRESGAGGAGGGGETEKPPEQKNVKYRLRSIVEDSQTAAAYSLAMLDYKIEPVHAGEAEDPLSRIGSDIQNSDRFSRLSTRSGDGYYEDFALEGGLEGAADAGEDLGGGIGYTSGRTRGNGYGGYGAGSGFGEGGEGDASGGVEHPLLADASDLAKPADLSGEKPNINVVNVSKFKGAIVPKNAWNPIIEWIVQHKKQIPVTLQKPEVLNQRSGDATTWVEFDDDANRHYTLYLLGRHGRPPQLNIFLITAGQGTLLQDEGAKGETEVYKHGTASGDPNNPTVQLEQLSPGKPEAKQMMRVFTAWWNHTKSREQQ